MAKYLMLVCIFLLSLLLFLAIKTTAKLSYYTLNDLEIESMILNLYMKLFNHISYAVALKQETNSSSIMEVIIKICLALLQDITLLTIIKIYSDVDLHEST
jgi:hypothetical protein